MMEQIESKRLPATPSQLLLLLLLLLLLGLTFMAAAKVSGWSAQSAALLPGRTRTCCSPRICAALWKQE
jgi:ABC-type uncharacterized transport system permease subunit